MIGFILLSLTRDLTLERNRHLVALQKLKNSAEFIANKKKIEQQIEIVIDGATPVATIKTPAE